LGSGDLGWCHSLLALFISEWKQWSQLFSSESQHLPFCITTDSLIQQKVKEAVKEWVCMQQQVSFFIRKHWRIRKESNGEGAGK
jgi:hypothetical protein